MAHAFDNPNASLSEGAPSLLWWSRYVEIRIGRGLERIPPRPLRQPWRGGARRVPASPGAPHGRGDGGGSDPPLLAAGAAREGGKVARPLATFTLPSAGVAPSTVIPAGRPPSTVSRSRWMSVSPCSFVT